MMNSMINENGVTFNTLEKNIFHGYVNWGSSSLGNSWNVMTKY